MVSSSAAVDEKASISTGDISTEFVSEPSLQSSKRSCLVIEIFSGSCRLSKACRSVGFRTTAIDKEPARSENFPIYQCDLTNPSEFALLKQYVEAEKDELLHAHFAPSCGTASRAREKAPGPPPLRSDRFPDGLPGHNPRDQERVDIANASYKAMIELASLLVQLGISFSIENPKNSLFWKCSWVKRFLATLTKYHICEFQHCMHGGKRNKFTHWLSFNPRNLETDMFQALHLLCDGSHEHASWKPYRNEFGQTVFPTASEAAYPTLLCDRVAYILKAEAMAAGFVFPAELDDQLAVEPNAAKRQIFATQPRGKKLRPLVSEFQSYKAVLFPLNNEQALQHFLEKMPKGTKICHRTLTTGGLFWDDKSAAESNLTAHEAWEDGQPGEIFHFGIPREPADFIKEAVAKGHPRDIVAKVPPAVRVLLDEFVCNNFERRCTKRAAFMKRWLKRSLELKADEDKLHAKLPPHLRHILKGKRLLLFKEILLDLNYKDAAVVDDIICGFKLTGWSPKTGVFDADVRKPELTLSQLQKMAPGLNASVIRAIDESAVDSTTQHVWDETLAEVEKGWLEPATSSHNCSVAKRFGLQQKNKVRMIDDFSISKVNLTYGLRERLRVQAVDELCAYLAYLLDNTTTVSAPRLKGRTFDLKSAYKQYGVDEWHRDFLRICVKNPSGGHGLFKVTALPFGATGSVNSFLRVSNALAYIGSYGLDIVWSAFFDDYTVLCCEQEETNVTFYVESLFRLLGINFAEEGDKAPPFQQIFKTLGLEFDLNNFQQGHFFLQHTESRRYELMTTLESILKISQTTPKELERLHGRLVWFNSFVFGRLMNHAVREISLACRSNEKFLRLGKDLRAALIQLKEMLQSCKPLEIGRSICKTWVIFTDGAFEPSATYKATVGGVLVSPSGVPIECFGEFLDERLVDELLQDSDHPIYELEVLPILLATSAWREYIKGSPVVFYIDNDAARSAYIQGVGATAMSKLFTDIFVRLENQLRLLSWFGRVPSHSNVADQPSRLQFDNPLLKACKRIHIAFPAHFDQVGLASGVLENPCQQHLASS